MESNTVPPAQRRFFLTLILGGVGATLAALAGWPVLRFLSPRSDSGGDSIVRVPRGQVPFGGSHFFNYRGRPAVLLQPRPGEYVALSAVCTHLGCIVKWEGDKGEFLCPCHGGRFSAEGTVLGGPPPAALPSFSVSLQGEDLVIG
ncbi:MAG: cytochrome B6 [Desulfuromonas sp.]|uniref:QcrA and Rieske domain-containing protein n=1 Tax=Desulfuromonas sp. TaxID=892 RepID=UPI000CAC44BA|nr:ubiquinol-cytochrome c reductase iron-sulfur subunit [Desulfuromonas sp.]PLX84149.1 MAG: cytochrome B6 [Desulfuromonas sp.]